MNRESVCCNRAFLCRETIAGGPAGSTAGLVQRSTVGSTGTITLDRQVSRRRFGGSRCHDRGISQRGGGGVWTVRFRRWGLWLFSAAGTGSCCLGWSRGTHGRAFELRGDGGGVTGTRGVSARAPALLAPYHTGSGARGPVVRENTEHHRSGGLSSGRSFCRLDRRDVVGALARGTSVFGSQSGEARVWRVALIKKRNKR